MLKGGLKVLILYSSGGSGLIQAAIAKEQEIQAENPTAFFIRKDMLKDWSWKFVALYSIRKWDHAQRIGDIKTLEWCIKRQKLFDFFFWPWIFYRATLTFFREKIDRIIDTQPLATSAVLFALRIYNWKSGKKVVLEKVAVDLPTKRNTHFFHSIKKLSRKSKEHLRLITLPPLLDSPTQSPQEFWRKHCRLNLDEVIYETYPVRQSFRKFQGMKRESKDFCFEARISNAEEGDLLGAAIRNGSKISTQMGESEIRFSIAPSDRVITLLLGSQPAFQGTLGYIQEMQRVIREFKPHFQVHLFVLCAKHEPGKDSLLKRVASLASNSQLNVIPLSFQSDEVIAPLFFRSDLTCTRCGGHTAMELMCTMQGEIWIHSESKKGQSLKDLLCGIPGWEAGNALYMRQFHNAKIVTPEQCSSHFQTLLGRWSSAT